MKNLYILVNIIHNIQIVVGYQFEPSENYEPFTEGLTWLRTVKARFDVGMESYTEQDVNAHTPVKPIASMNPKTGKIGNTYWDVASAAKAFGVTTSYIHNILDRAPKADRLVFVSISPAEYYTKPNTTSLTDNSKPVKMYAEDGCVVFSSIGEASRKLGIDRRTITKYIDKGKDFVLATKEEYFEYANL